MIRRTCRWLHLTRRCLLAATVGLATAVAAHPFALAADRTDEAAPLCGNAGTWVDPQTGAVLGHDQVVRSMADRSVVLLGESHTSAEHHRWQLSVLASLHGQNPDDSLPPADTGAATLKLISEIEMALHEQAVNARRQARGLPPVNLLWIWGGGYAPQQGNAPLPALYADEPLLRGFWHSVSASTADWPGSIDACLDAREGSFVAVVRPGSRDSAGLHSDLLALRGALRSGRLRSGVLLSADGIHVILRRSDRFRAWRRTSPLLGDPPP